MLPFAQSFPGYRSVSPVSNLTYVGLSFTDTADQGNTGSHPTGINAGDLIILFDYIISGSPATPVTPSGFTTLGNQFLNSTFSKSVFLKIADGNEDGGTWTGATPLDDNGGCKISLVMRPNNPVTSFTAGTSVGVHSNSNPAARTILSSSGTSPILIVGFNSATSAPTSTMTPTELHKSAVANVNWFYSHDVIVGLITGSPANVSLDMTDAGTANNIYGSYASLS